ncbi:MAG: DNA polymerase I, partial [Rhodospirillales bacterium]|nr:DNA polymerase I [Rhodospirillales bacterium]
MKPEHVYLIDGSGFIFRAFYGLPPMTRGDGTPVNAVFGFTKMVMKLVEDTDADHIAVIFDTKRKTFRNDIYAEYKANRDAPPEELVPQFDLVRQATDALNIARVEMEGFEADDLIATYARQAVEAGADVTIVTSDKDMMQLVTDKISIFDAMKNRKISHDEVIEKFGVAPDKVVDVQALAGDSSDNVPGVRGIGIKTAALLINEYGDLDTLLERAGEIKQPKRRESLINEADMARVSRDLVTLKNDVPAEATLESFVTTKPNKETLLAFLLEQSFRTLANKLDNSMEASSPSEAGDAGQASPEKPKTVEKSYSLVQDIAALQGWVDKIYQHGSVTIDTETTSLDSMQAELVGVSLSCVPGEACYIPLAHRKAEVQASLFGDLEGDDASSDDQIEQIPLSDAIALLKPMLADPSILKIGQNIKYDMQVLSRYDVTMESIDDTMMLSYVLDVGLGSHGMDAMALRHLDMETIKFKEVVGSGKSQITFDLVALDKALDYAAEDADITQRLYEMLKPRLVEDSLVTVYETLERPLIPILERMERTGIIVDRDALSTLSTDFAARMIALE